MNFTNKKGYSENVIFRALSVSLEALFLLKKPEYFCFVMLQYYSDANDAESWMKEKMSVVSSEDYGRDEQSAMVYSIPEYLRVEHVFL